jgi:hypothetical protein
MGVATAVSLPLLAAQNPASGPIARYDVKAGTVSGTAAMGAGSMMGMMLGGRTGNNVQHELLLRLGSSQAATKGEPRAEHFMPATARLGKSVLLSTPRVEREEGDQFSQKPKGRLLLFWGCGANAPKGQPVVIDFAKIAAGQMPAGIWTTTILRDRGPSSQNSRTFGHWPYDDGKSAKPDSSLIGAHRIASNYAPEISFTATRDFMQPLQVTNRQQAGGSSLLSWNSITVATGYLAFATGGKMGPNHEMGDMVIWTSSATRQFGGGLSDWLSPAQVASLVKDRTVMPPTATSCMIPAEVRQAMPDFSSGTLTAFGPEEDFSYPPRPASEATPWRLEWTARIRHRSVTSWMEAQGMSMGAMGARGAQGDDGQQNQGQQNPGQQKRCKPKGLGGMLGGIMRGAGGC